MAVSIFSGSPLEIIQSGLLLSDLGKTSRTMDNSHVLVEMKTVKPDLVITLK